MTVGTRASNGCPEITGVGGTLLGATDRTSGRHHRRRGPTNNLLGVSFDRLSGAPEKLDGAAEIDRVSLRMPGKLQLIRPQYEILRDCGKSSTRSAPCETGNMRCNMPLRLDRLTCPFPAIPVPVAVGLI